MGARDDAIARQKGFKNYYEYRNYLAQLQGYKNYNEQRKARKAAKAGNTALVKGTDRARFGIVEKPATRRAARQLAKAVPDGIASDGASMAVAWGFPRPSLAAHQDAFEEVYQHILETGEYRKQFGSMQGIAEKNNRALLAAQKRTLDSSLSSKDNLLGHVYRLGLQDGGATPEQITEVMRGLNADDDLLFRQEEFSYAVGKWATHIEERASQFDETYRKMGIYDASGKNEKKRFLKRARITAFKDRKGNQWQLESAEKFLTQKYLRETWELGFFRGLDFGNVAYVEVLDGPGCGVYNHNDPLKANGLVMTLEQARQHPSAHPFCVRRFVPTKNTPGNKRKSDDLQKMLEVPIEERIARAAEELSRGGGYAKAAVGVGAVAGVLGIATTEIAGRVLMGGTELAFEGTLADWMIEFVLQRAQLVMQKIQDLQARIISVFSQSAELKAMAKRLTDAAMDLRTQFPDFTQAQAEAYLAEQIHAEQLAWEMTGENVTSLATRRVIRKGAADELVTRKVVGDDWENWDKLHNLRVFASDRVEGGVKEVAELFEDQNIFIQALLNRVRPVGGKYGKFSLPKIDVREGAERATHRYARMTLNPNDMTHLHISARPNRDGTIRTVKNLRVNPNGLFRMGFTLDDRGVVTPNFSIVPKGPLRVYSKINRAPKEIKRREKIGEGVVRSWYEANPAAGRFNSMTTQVSLLTRWTDHADAMSVKFRLNLRQLGIYKAQHILEINPTKLRFMMAQEDWFTFVNYTINLRLKGFGLFDIKKSIRFDDRRLAITQLGLRNVDNDIRLLIDFYISSIRQAKEAGAVSTSGYITDAVRSLHDELKTSQRLDRLEELLQERGVYDQLANFRAFLDVHKGVLQSMADSELFEETREAVQATRTRIIEQRLEAARKAGIPPDAIRDDIGPAPDKFISWDMARWIYDMSQVEVQGRVNDLTNYLIAQRRQGVRPGEEIVGTVFRTPDPEDVRFFKEIMVERIEDVEEELLLKRPNLILAFLESDPKKIAKELGVKILDIQARKERLWDTSNKLLTTYTKLLPEKQREAMLLRLERMDMRREVFIPDGDYENTAGVLRWLGGSDDWKGFEPGKSYSSRKFGRPQIYETVDDTINSLGDHSKEITEFVIDGESTQTMKDSAIRLNGSYLVTGRSTMFKGSIYDFPPWYPDDVEVVNRVYLRQLNTEVDYNPLASTLNLMPQQQGEAHLFSHLALRQAHPDVADAATRLVHGIASDWDKTLLKEVADAAPVHHGFLYRSANLTDADIAALGRRSKLVEKAALYEPDTSEIGDVVIAAREVRGFNISPLSPSDAGRSRYFVNGELQVQEIREILDSDTGRKRTYIFVRWLRPTEL